MAKKLNFDHAGRALVRFKNGYTASVVRNPFEGNKESIILMRNGRTVAQHEKLTIKNGYLAINCDEVKRNYLLSKVACL